jgi:hypothetical protein
MKLQRLKHPKNTSPTVDHHEEMSRLYERLTTNGYSDSETVRQTILGRMIFLTFKSITK